MHLKPGTAVEIKHHPTVCMCVFHKLFVTSTCENMFWTYVFNYLFVVYLEDQVVVNRRWMDECLAGLAKTYWMDGGRMGRWPSKNPDQEVMIEENVGLWQKCKSLSAILLCICITVIDYIHVCIELMWTLCHRSFYSPSHRWRTYTLSGCFRSWWCVLFN